MQAERINKSVANRVLATTTHPKEQRSNVHVRSTVGLKALDLVTPLHREPPVALPPRNIFSAIFFREPT